MLKTEYGTDRLLAVAMTAAAMLCLSAPPASASSTVTPPLGMVEEVPLSGFSSNQKQSDLVTIGLGPEDNVWFPQERFSAPSTPMLWRATATGLINGEFSIPPPPSSTQGWSEVENEITGIAAGLYGSMWFTDVTTPGSEEFVGSSTASGEISIHPVSAVDPAGIALGSDGAMWFLERATGEIGRIDEGAISSYRVPGVVFVKNQSEDSTLNDIALGSDGAMWFTSSGSNELQSFIGRITPSGKITEFNMPTNDAQPSGIAQGANDSMWFTEPGVDRIGRITLNGEISEFQAQSVGDAIAPGADGDMWFTEGAGVDALGRITPSGLVTNFAPILNHHDNPMDLIAGSRGDLWLTDISSSRIFRIVVPLAPVNTGLPVISGDTTQGNVLSASEGTWSQSPSDLEYQWQICDDSGSGCADLSGATASTHVLTAEDVGHTLRVVVSAGDIGGSTAATSAVSAIVVVAPSIPITPPQVPVSEPPAPVVGTTVTWGFEPRRAYTVVESLIVHGLPAGGLLEVSCDGRGCPFSDRSSATAATGQRCHTHRCQGMKLTPLHGNTNLAGIFKSRHLRAGTRIVVTITKASYIGKSYLFTIRAGHAPSVQAECLKPGSKVLGEQC
jgi:virginiamycin B lyase